MSAKHEFKFPDKDCDLGCGRDEYTTPWIIRINGKIVGSCKTSYGAFSCPISPENKRLSKCSTN